MINVLIVDDDAMVAELNYRYVTQLQGFQCSGVASSLQQAKELVLNPEHPIDLILLDVYMQMENGLDLLPVLRSAQRQIDVIIISSASDAETIKKSLHYGVVDYLIKPFQFGRFEEALMNWKRKKSGWIISNIISRLNWIRLSMGGASQQRQQRKPNGCRKG